MTARKDTIFERFLAPVVTNLLIDRDAILRYYYSKDWERAGDRFRQPDFGYPDYYQSQNFHGIPGGYLTPQAAITYDPITRYALPPHEEWVRQGLIERIQTKPRRILDLGCGTGSTTVMLKHAFPQAEVIGVDLSPYMLVAADDKARKAGLSIEFQQGNAERTHFPDRSFDLIAIALLFHETPVDATQNILRECLRLLTVGGELLILDGDQSMLRQTTWLTEIFEEPYIKDFAKGNLAAWMGELGFGNVQSDRVWLLHEVTRGVKPIPGEEAAETEAENWDLGDRQWAMG